MAAYPYRYRPPRRFRYGRGTSKREIAAGLTIGVVLAGGASAQTVVNVTHHRSDSSVNVAVAVTSGAEDSFIRAILGDLRAPATDANVTSIRDWYPHEWGSWPPGAQDNPLDSTLPMSGSWAFNSLPGGGGVQNYPSATEGAQATALTLTGGNYPRIVAALRSGAGLCGDPSLTAEFSTWSGGGYSGSVLT